MGSYTLMPGWGSTISTRVRTTFRRRVKLSRFLSRRVGEKLDQIFVGCAKQVGKLEVLVAERNLLEVLDEVGKRVVIERALADLAVEVDVFEHVLQRMDVHVFQRFERLVEAGPDVGLEVANLRPMGIFGNEEGVFIRIGELRGNLALGHPSCLEVLGKLLALLVEQIAHPFQEEHAEDVFLVFGCIHVPAQIVAGTEQEAGQLTEGELSHVTDYAAMEIELTPLAEALAGATYFSKIGAGGASPLALITIKR